MNLLEDKLKWAFRPGVGAPFARVVLVQTTGRVGGDTGVERAIGTAKDVNEPRLRFCSPSLRSGFS